MIENIKFSYRKIINLLNSLRKSYISRTYTADHNNYYIFFVKYISQFPGTISGYSLSKKITRNCIICFKHQSRTNTQLMGNLPANTSKIPSPTYYCYDMDYAGPFLTKVRRSRGILISKEYLFLFIYFSTKAIQLEFITALTTDCLIVALWRFIWRSGKPRAIYSDSALHFTRQTTNYKIYINSWSWTNHQ